MDTPLSVFNRLIEKTEDPFWKDIFAECLKGKFPKGIFYDRKSYIVKHGKICIDLINTPIDELYSSLYELFRKCGNISTEDERALESKLDTTKNIKTDIDCAWKDIVPKQYQNVLLQEYIDALCITNGITDPKKKDRLYSHLCILIKFKIIGGDNIIYKDRKIIDITKLTFDPKECTFLNEIKSTVSIKTPRLVDNTFLKALRKYGKKLD